MKKLLRTLVKIFKDYLYIFTIILLEQFWEYFRKFEKFWKSENIFLSINVFWENFENFVFENNFWKIWPNFENFIKHFEWLRKF